MTFDDLINLVRAHDFARIEQIIAEGTDLSLLISGSEPTSGWTLLKEAVGQDDAQIVQLLIDTGADVNREDADGWTPVFNAALDANIPIIRLLLLNGADINHRDNTGDSPLRCVMVSCDFRKTPEEAPLYTETIKFLCEQGANANSLSIDGSSVLMMAVTQQCLEAVQYLISKKADVNVSDEDGWTALMWAARKGSRDIATLLVDNGAVLDAQNVIGNTALIIASMHGHDEVMHYLIAAGADENVANSDSETYKDWIHYED